MMLSCEVLAFIEELINQIAAISASPGFTWGDSGSIGAGDFLINDTVASNKAGRLVPLKAGEVTNIFVVNENANTFELQLLKRTGVGITIAAFTEIALVSVAAVRLKSFGIADFGSTPLIFEDELAMRLKTGSAKNLVAGAILRGNTQ